LFSAEVYMRTLRFECTYEEFLDIKGRRDSADNKKLWLDTVAFVNKEHHDMIKDDLNDTIAQLADEITI